jgi:hypothetical protein
VHFLNLLLLKARRAGTSSRPLRLGVGTNQWSVGGRNVHAFADFERLVLALKPTDIRIEPAPGASYLDVERVVRVAQTIGAKVGLVGSGQPSAMDR